MNARRTGTARIAVVLLLGAIVAAGVSAGISRATSRNLALTTQFQHIVSRLLSLVIDTESEQRGYLLTGDQAYVASYAASVRDLKGVIRSLSALTEGDVDKSAQIDRISAAVDARLGQFNQTIANYRAHLQDTIAASVRAGEAAISDLRDSVARLQVAEEDVLDGRRAVFVASENLLFASIIIATLISLALFRIQGQMVRGNIEALEASATALRSSNMNLEATVAARVAELGQSKQQAEGLAAQLADNLRRFDLTLRSSSVIAFTQDRELHFTWISRDAMDHHVFQIVGKQADTLMDAEAADIVALKRRVIETGVATRAEVSMDSDGKTSWYELRLEPMRDDHGAIAGLMGVSVEITERRERESKIQLLLREITHRSKNLLAVIQSMARQTAMRTVSPAAFVNVFSQRIQSLALSHDLLLQSDWAGAPLKRVLQAQLAPFSELIGTRIEYDGPDIYLKPEAAQGIGMAIHELITNAAKFGALSVPSGKIQAVWCMAPESEDEDGTSFRFEWRESDVPKVTRPERRGFGHVVLESATARALSGTSQFTYAPDGATWRLDIPSEWITISTSNPH